MLPYIVNRFAEIYQIRPETTEKFCSFQEVFPGKDGFYSVNALSFVATPKSILMCLRQVDNAKLLSDPLDIAIQRAEDITASLYAYDRLDIKDTPDEDSAKLNMDAAKYEMRQREIMDIEHNRWYRVGQPGKVMQFNSMFKQEDIQTCRFNYTKYHNYGIAGEKPCIDNIFYAQLHPTFIADDGQVMEIRQCFDRLDAWIDSLVARGELDG